VARSNAEKTEKTEQKKKMLSNPFSSYDLDETFKLSRLDEGWRKKFYANCPSLWDSDMNNPENSPENSPANCSDNADIDSDISKGSKNGSKSPQTSKSSPLVMRDIWEVLDNWLEQAENATFTGHWNAEEKKRKHWPRSGAN
jgi:hypothetical protein